MYLTILLSLLLLRRVQGGEFLVAKTPPSIELLANGTIDQSALPEVFSSVLGFTSDTALDWHSMKIIDPFNFAKVVVVLYVDGINSLNTQSFLKKLTLHNDESILSTWENINNKVTGRYPMNNSSAVMLNFDSIENISKVSSNFLDMNDKEDFAFLKEIYGLNKYLNGIKKVDKNHNLYWFYIKNLHKISNLKGPSHPATEEAKNMVFKSFLLMSEIFNDIYKDRVFVVSLISDSAQTRKIRSTNEENKEYHKIAVDVKNNIYDPDFPIIFNIILWFTVALVFSLLAVSVFIASMDPGRDSIIYRMTSNRMKKDS